MRGHPSQNYIHPDIIFLCTDLGHVVHIRVRKKRQYLHQVVASNVFSLNHRPDKKTGLSQMHTAASACVSSDELKHQSQFLYSQHYSNPPQHTAL